MTEAGPLARHGLIRTQMSQSSIIIAAWCCLLVSGLVEAQDGGDTEETRRVEVVRVTGSRIKRLNIEGPAPVDLYPRELLVEAGVNTLGEFFRDLPQSLGQVSTLAQGSGFAGAEFINLRGIGIDNTLTLINGKRVAPYGRNGSAEPFVDISAIPVSAIERVEILKDGASAIYGADAVAGVVNIILRQNFEGVDVGAGYSTATEGDGEEWRGDLVWGWSNDDTDFVATLSWLDRSPILARDREWSDDVDFTAEDGPNLRAFNGTPSSYLNFETFQYVPDPECGVDPRISSVRAFPGFGEFCVFNYAWFQQLTYDSESLAANFSLTHDLSPALRGRVEVFYSQRDNIAILAPTPVLGGIIPANHPDNPFGVTVDLAGRPLDTGDRRFDTSADTYRLVAGLEGNWAQWEWSADLLASGNNVDTSRLNAVFSDRYYAALAGMGGPNGDMWYNPFGANPVNDPVLIDWMTASTNFGADTAENAVEVAASRFFGSLAGGPIGIAVGLQYRKQELDEFADELERSGRLAGGNQITQIDADRDIFAAYVELSLPLTRQLEVQAALRYDDYSDFGNSTNPKIALAWRPNDQWLARTSYSTSFRPPTFNELFNPAVLNAGFFVDVERCEGTGAQADCGPFQYPVLNTGNPELEPEEGESWFAGLVWSPSRVVGLDIEVDWWRFEHSERIVELNPQLILDAKSNKGVARADPTDEDVALGVPGRIIQLTQTFENSDTLETSGIDVISRYLWESAGGSKYGLTLNYTHVSEYRLEESALGSVQSDINFAGAYFNFRFGVPRHRGNLKFDWHKGGHGLAANVNYIGDFEGPFPRYEDGFPTESPWIVDSYASFDLQYRFHFAEPGITLRLGCRNCSDEAPSMTFNIQGDGLYDYRGAMVYARLEYGF